MLLDLIRSITALLQFQREAVDSDGGRVVVATEEDFALAREIYEALSNESGGQMTKLTRAEAALVDAIRSTGRSLFTIGDMQTLVDRSYSTIYRMLHNLQSRGNQHTGLPEKCPPLTLYDRTETDDTTGTQKRTRVYVWDYDMDRIWSSGGGCWLTDPDEGSDQGEGPDDDGSGYVCTTVH